MMCDTVEELPLDHKGRGKDIPPHRYFLQPETPCDTLAVAGELAGTGRSSDSFFHALDLSSVLRTRPRFMRTHRKECLSRVELERAFDRIDETIPQLLGGGLVTPGFWVELSEVISKHMGRTSADDYEWIVGRLKALLAIHGVTIC
jgi:hypothetical protein